MGIGKADGWTSGQAGGPVGRWANSQWAGDRKRKGGMNGSCRVVAWLGYLLAQPWSAVVALVESMAHCPGPMSAHGRHYPVWEYSIP